MTPLANRSVNSQSRIPVVGLESRSRANDENVPPVSNLTRLLAPTKSSVARSASSSSSPIPIPLKPRTVSAISNRGHLNTVASNDSLNSSFARRQSLGRPSPVQVPDTLRHLVSKSPTKSTRRAMRQGRPSSSAAEITQAHDQVPEVRTGRRNKSLLLEKPLPSRPFYVAIDSMTPTRETCELSDASAWNERQQSAVSPQRPVTRRGNVTPSGTPGTTSRVSSKLPRSSVPNSPLVVSPILPQVSNSFSSPHCASPVSSLDIPSRMDSKRPALSVTYVESPHPPRFSSLRTPEPKNQDAGLGMGIDTSVRDSYSADHHERRYLPAENSFSRPRAQHLERSSASAMSLSVPQSHSSRVPRSPIARTASPKTTPTIVRSPPISKPSVTDDVLKFAGRRLDNPADFATLDQGSARPLNRRGQPPKVPPHGKNNLTVHDSSSRASSPSDPNKLSPMRFIFGDNKSASDDVFEYTRVKKLSGGLLSSSFIGSTLSISDEADHLIMGPERARTPSFVSRSSLAAPADADLELPSPSENGFHVSWPANFGFNPADLGPESPTVQSSPSVRPKTFSRISEGSEQSIMEENIGGLEQRDIQRTDYVHHTGGIRPNHDSRNEDSATLSMLEGNSARKRVPSGTTSKPTRTRISTTKPSCVSPKTSGQGRARTCNDRDLSCMLPTQASEARKSSVVPPLDIRHSKANSAPSSDSHRALQATRLVQTCESSKGDTSPHDKLAQVPELCGETHSGRSTPVPAIPRSETSTTHPSQLSGQTTVAQKSSHKRGGSFMQCGSLGNIKIGRQSPEPTEISRDGTFPSTKSRSEAKGKSVFDNLKGLFSSKREISSTSGSGGRGPLVANLKSASTDANIPEVPAVPSLPDSRKEPKTKSILVKKTAVEEVQSPEFGTSRGPSAMLKSQQIPMVKNAPASMSVAERDIPSLLRKVSKNDLAAAEAGQEADLEFVKRDTVTLMEMGITLRQEASKEGDLVRKERMTSFAQVMLDTVTNAVEAERNMYTAMQAAEQAKLSYMMTQQSVQEMNKLVSTSHRSSLFKKKRQEKSV
ncbi:hypothetical protein E4T39_04664 [Aureobasidium subglaciale]|nr:hypothetical protein E4T39_04664 [Aureobasidium subglaciale]